MRICVRLPDSILSRAIIELLRAHGHEATTFEAGIAPCALRIDSGEPANHSSDGCPTLLLRRGGAAELDPDPAKALHRALEEGGLAVWDAPLDTRLLVDVLRDHAGDVACAVQQRRPKPPDLSTAPHEWIVVEADRERLVDANDEARSLLGLGPHLDHTGLADLPLGGHLREALREQADGVRTSSVSGADRVTAWWTEPSGRVIVCFLPAPALQQAADRAGRALARLGQMAATLAHEIRNPVASLAGALDLLESESDPADRAEVLVLARQRLGQLSRLLEKTLSLARPIEGPHEVVEVMPVIESAVSTMRLDPHFERVTIEVDAPETPVFVHAFEGPLLQALINLLLNAAQAQPDGGSVEVRLTHDTRRAVLRVQDAGPGIPPDKRRDVFLPFYTTKPTGTGLGLPEVRRLVEAVGGAITVEDTEAGACFRLELPLAPPG